MTTQGAAPETARPSDYRIEDGPALLEEMSHGFETARTKCPDAVEEIHVELGHGTARIRTVGRHLATIVRRPLAQLLLSRAPAQAPSLTIDLWDEHETGVPCASRTIDETLGITGVVHSSADGRFIGQQRARSFSLYDRSGPRIVGWSNYVDGAFLDEMGRPLQLPISFWFADAGMQIVHAALVAHRGCGVLMPGLSGSGKSTSSLVCLKCGLDYLGDDHIGISEGADGVFAGHGLYSSTHVEPSHLERFGIGTDFVIPAGHAEEDKSLVLLDEAFPGRCARRVPIRAITVPRVIDAEETRYERGTTGEALLALAPSSMVMIPGNRPAGTSALDALARLASSVPCYRLLLGRRLESIADRIRELVEEIGP